jgi:nucleotide-binding universal stress UspA family protein
MVELNRILCPVDISDFSQHALCHAVKIAVWFGSEVTVFHVMPPPVHDTIDTARHLALRNLQGMVERARRPGVSIAIELVESSEPAARILERAATMDADLIVMGSHGRKGVPRVVLGSVVETMLHRSGRPILVVPSHLAPKQLNQPISFGRILCAVDFTETSIAGLEYALALAEEANAELTLLHVIEVPPELKTPPQPPDFCVDHIRAVAERECVTRLRALVPEAAADYCSIKTEVIDGGATRQILRIAAGHDSDLIVLGVHDRKAFDLLIFGSDSNAVIRDASCPVLVVPQRLKSSLRAAS